MWLVEVVVVADYGPIRSAPIIERALAVTFGKWFGGYLGDTLAQAGHDRYGLMSPTNIVRVVDIDGWPMEDNLAVGLIAMSEGDSTHQGGENYGITYEMRAGVAVTTGDFTATREAAQFYAAATICLAHKGADGLDDVVVTWQGEGLLKLRDEAERALMLGFGRFTVSVPDARALYGGPDEPPSPPTDRPEGTPDAIVQSVNIDTERT